MPDITDVIEDAITDAELPEPDPVEATPEPSPEAVPEALAAPTSDDLPPDNTEVASPATKEPTEPAKAADDFDKKFGLQPQSVGGRENRIPYSRVRKIADNAVKDAKTEWEKEYTPKAQAYETKIKDYESKLSAYEPRLREVAEFEHLMANDAVTFVTRLASLPQYQQILAPLFQQQQPQQPVDPQAVTDDMPQPDEKLADGSLVYSMNGLKQLNAWNRAQARKEVLTEVEQHYGPMREQFMAERKLQSILPQVQAQITEARKWPLFNEHEDDITKALQQNQNLSLEGAYRQVVLPKIQSDRNRMREEILSELKKAPTATTVPARGSKPVPATHTSGPRSLESVIAEAVKTIK